MVARAESQRTVNLPAALDLLWTILSIFGLYTVDNENSFSVRILKSLNIESISISG